MSIFKKSLKTFTSNILGEPKEFKINNMVWLHMETNLGVSQKEYMESGQDRENLMNAKLVTAVLVANGYEVTEQEVIENTDQADIAEFVMSYNKVIMKKFDDIFKESEEGKSQAKPK